MSILLRLVNAPLELAAALRRHAYLCGLRQSHEAPVPVISVGNIAMGGTGKTPLVEALATTLLGQGARPAILTRGYRRQSKSPLVLKPGQEVPWTLAGDEPTLLARRLPGVLVVVDADRVRGATIALQAGATHLLLDDGFQHLRLRRHVDLVVVRAEDPLARGCLRREGPRALAHATRLVCVGEAKAQEEAARLLQPYHPVPPFPVALRPVAWFWQGQRRSLDELSQRKVLAFAGIAGPSRFFHTLHQLGAQVVGQHAFPDHHPFRPQELALLAKKAEQTAALLFTTAKDHVRLPLPWAQQVAYLEVTLVPLAGSFSQLLPPFG